MIDEIVNVARAVHYEMSYLNHVSKSDVLSESSFKYPAVEWLERKGGKEKVLFEKSHPVFFKRMTDISWVENGLWSYIEMKYVKEETADDTEQQRFFNDLLRLAHILVDNPTAKVYFLACGQTINWMPCFQNLGMKTPDGGVPIESYKDEKEREIQTAEGYYSRWFSFKGSDAKKEINTSDYKQFYDEFSQKYKFKKDTGTHPEQLEFYTTLRWISEVNGLLSPCATAAWEISLKG